ncbi:MAG: GTP 3',8-cyclase MoaA, partial [Armatimonadota bacterium]|nr:GTP 3',8-cyclase MoaA [Armatimonadota bacterium]
FGRTIDYLRVSVTDRCNFRCLYCMPAEGTVFVPREEILSFEEIETIVGIAARLGIHKVRLTGGEPLVRQDIAVLVRMIASIPGIQDVSMTTNGSLLPDLAQPLKEAGLRRLNISLDSLDEEVCERMSRGGKLQDVLAGIQAAQDAGLAPIKVNAVVVRGLNDLEAPALARLSVTQNLHVRFIELMPIGWSPEDEPAWEVGSACEDRGEASASHAFGKSLVTIDEERMTQQALSTPIRGLETLGFEDLRERFVSSQETRERIERTFGPLEPAEVVTNGPARVFRIPGAGGTLGFISQISHDFCASCNRMRLTAEGTLRPCLMADGEEDLRAALRGGGGRAEVERRILRALGNKPFEHRLNEGIEPHSRVMSQIGG